MFHLYERIKNNQMYYIAEMSANHGGSLETALEIVRQVAKTGAHCLKIQTYTADSLTIKSNEPEFKITGGLWDGYTLYDLYANASMPYEWHAPIKSECEKNGLDFLSTPFDINGVDFLEELGVEAYKIASFEIVDIPLIKYVASKHKPMIISCGMASVEEIQEAVDACKRMGNEEIVLLKCCSEYPAPWEDMKLMNIPDMEQRFSLPIGLSDHSQGSLGAVVAASLGAVVIEKHVKIDGVSSVDDAFSMTISEYRDMIKDVESAKKMLVGPDYNLTDGEKSSFRFRRSLFVVKDIAKGEEFTKENIRSVRPSFGMKPKYYDEILGKKSSCDIKKGTPLNEGYIV